MMRAPDFEQNNVKAWKVPIVDPPRKPHSTLAQWLVQADGFHVLWNRWVLFVLHLRDVAGVAPAVKSYEAATHEIIIGALDPDAPFDPNGEMPAPFMTPMDYARQIDVASDDIATEILEGMVKLILLGRASPDADFRSGWDSIIDNTMDHFKTGHGGRLPRA